MKKTYNVDVDCANCAAKMEDAVKKTPGVQNAALSFMTLKLKVEFEAGADVDAVMAAARKNCKREAKESAGAHYCCAGAAGRGDPAG